MTVTYTAECPTCGWTAGPGGPEVDRAAEKHVKTTKHSTTTRYTTAKEDT